MDLPKFSDITDGPLEFENPNHEPSSFAETETWSPVGPEKAPLGCSCPADSMSRECKSFVILRDFLQPNTTSISSSTSNAVDRVLKEYPVSEDFPVTETDIFNLACMCVELAEQIPYYHSAHEKLARLVCAIGNEEAKTSNAITGFKGKLGMHLRDRFRVPHDGVDPSDREGLARCVNFHAFCAHLENVECGMRSKFATWTLRDAFEDSHHQEEKETSTVHEACVLTAAQWILWNGQSLYRASRSWKRDVTRKNWQAWKKKFIEAANDSGQFSKECRAVAAEAAERMGTLDGERRTSSRAP